MLKTQYLNNQSKQEQKVRWINQNSSTLLEAKEKSHVQGAIGLFYFSYVENKLFCSCVDDRFLVSYLYL